MALRLGDELKSWKQMLEDSFDRFTYGTYAENCEAKLIEELDRHLPENSPWVK